jgi:phosphatidylserine/phosphatidylglycerophosphate/cardiolipin synthase-like enzyme
MIVFVPISRFRVSYDVAMGRPYSRLEALVLRAVADGAGTVDELENLFRVHRRLLVESLVTLTQAGWLALGASDEKAFLLTSEGEEALQVSETPRSRVVDSRYTIVLMERITGACISNDAFRYWSNREIEKREIKGARLRSCVGANRLEDADVVGLLPRRQGEWIHWIGPIEQDSKLNHWLAVSVDVDRNEILGLPDEWKHRLADHVLSEAKRFAPGLTSKERKAFVEHFERRPSREGADALRLPESVFPTNVTEGDFLFNQQDHLTLLRTAFSEARTSVLVMSAFLSLPCAQLLKGDLLRALQRGINVDLMWGYAADAQGAEGKATAWLRELANSTKASGVRGVLRLNEVASRSHAKLLLWDGLRGFEACVGSFNWLSASGTDDPEPATSGEVTNVSVRITQPAIVSRICRRAAVLWDTTRSEVMSSTGDRWRQVATELEACVSAPTSDEATGGNAIVSVVADRDHEYLLRRELASAQLRLVIVSHKLGAVAETRMIAASDRIRKAAFTLSVRYGESTIDSDARQHFTELVQKAGGNLKQVQKLHAKVLVSDDVVCISSYNFLSADPYGAAKESRELGILIVGAEPCQWVFDRLSKL